jgi:hypothetical protein
LEYASPQVRAKVIERGQGVAAAVQHVQVFLGKFCHEIVVLKVSLLL